MDADSLKKLKVVDLKELLKERELPVSGKKDELIERLLESENATAGAEAVKPEPEANANEVPDAAPAPAAMEVDEAEQRPAKRVKLAATEDEQVPETKPEAAPKKEDEDLKPNGHAAKVEQEDLKEVFKEEEPKPEFKEEEVKEEAYVDDEDDTVGIYDFSGDADKAGAATDMYLDTINRPALDFDFEKLCSVTLTHNNIYACLVDGKYFSGRGSSSPAYAHSISEDHHVFVNLTTRGVHVLPDDYEVKDPSLDDIKYVLYPTFSKEQLARIDAAEKPAYDLTNQPFWPGFVGLNNIKSNTWANSVLQSLLHVLPLRDYLLLTPLPEGSSELIKRFATLARKLWNPRAFKGQVSPHEFLQECANASQGRFKITERADPAEFLGWLLNRLHMDLGGTKKPRSSIIYSAFQGELRVDDQSIITTGELGSKQTFDLGREIKSVSSPFLFLSIDLPPPPLFQDHQERNIIPQVPIAAVLAKYDGSTTQEQAGVLRRFKVKRLPPYLILSIKRFTKNNFVEERNPTIMNFPLSGVDVRDYVDDPTDTLAKYYDLVSNLTHSGDSGANTARTCTNWKTQVHLKPSKQMGEDDKWFEMEDLRVNEVQKGMIPLGESYIQIWERRDVPALSVEVPKAKADKRSGPPKAGTSIGAAKR